jgi:hypothetical protein
LRRRVGIPDSKRNLIPVRRRRLPIHEVADPSDALDVLEGYAHQPDFDARWRAFLRDCALLLLPGLPPEASDWVAAADEFEAGRLSADGLTAARVRAWQFHDARRDTSPPAVLSGLRAVMYRLWPPDSPNRWHESGWHFLHFCDEAGLRVEQWRPLLQARFGGILGWQP